MSVEHEDPYQHLIVGGGLAGGLIALALANAGRGARVALIEQDLRLAGNHTWSFHHTDLRPEELALVQPFVCGRWSRHAVRFPDLDRTFETGYSSISSERFADVLTRRLVSAGVHLHLGSRVTGLGPTLVRLEDGTVLRGGIVIDARGPDPVAAPASRDVAFQKFVGLELELRSDGPWTTPLLMDAAVPQLGGYRFIYVLPFSPRHVLVEDTVYSRNPVIDPIACAGRVLAYAAQQGASVRQVLRREVGVLPLPLRESDLRPSPTRPIGVGYRGGFFHPVTGYSLPIATRVALAIAGARTPGETRAAVRHLSIALRPQRRFGLLLNRLLFDAMPPGVRWTALRRFYALPEATIARFYASRSTLLDRVRVLLGRPPAGISWPRLLGSRWQQSRQPQSEAP